MDAVSCLCTNARRAALALTAVYDEALAPHGLKVTQFSLLHAVKRHGAPNLTALSAATGLDRSTLGRNLRVLASAGLVRLGAGDDQRDRVAELTESGRLRLREATRTWARLQEGLADTLGEDAGRLSALSHRVASRLRPLAADPEAR
jgi:DNA-binding MarR family transcriptional regulator